MTATAILPTVPRTDHVPKLLRFPPELASRIERMARRDYRTFTAQVLMMLEQWLREHPTSDRDPK